MKEFTIGPNDAGQRPGKAFSHRGDHSFFWYRYAWTWVMSVFTCSLSSEWTTMPGKAQVRVFDRPVPGGKTAVTVYRTLDARDGLSLVECDLITGRTHQIRAQFAAAGHPLLGDGKYGRERDGRKFQALYSYKLRFDFTTDAGCLAHLNGREAPGRRPAARPICRGTTPPPGPAARGAP